jgi:N-acetylmuramic acid 6-phosphate etherase
LTTGAFIRRGYVFGNLMVNVQPKNNKLRDRARRIVEKAAEVSDERAKELLSASGDSVRVAIVMSRAGVDRTVAEQLLEAAGGRVAAALKKANHG